MLTLDDPRWTELNGGYKTRFDPRPFFARLESGRDVKAVWHELWGELYHQGDIGEASFAAIPHLVRIHRNCGTIDWNIYAIVTLTEQARGCRGNPDAPDWLQEAYFNSIQELAEAGAAEIVRVDDSDTTRAILSILALAKGLRTHARLLLEYSDQELNEIGLIISGPRMSP
jgi:hypothetical protein